MLHVPALFLAFLLMCGELNQAAHALESDLPPVGRSRFDELVGHAPVPFPFARLRKSIEAQMRPDPGGLPTLKTTLVPLGRSLQRHAGAPDFFRFPRVVAAADGLNKPGYAPLQDRLFLGYHEKGEVIEVISYNDAAGRFEFQVVRDYAPGKTPRVFYARRSLCLACHQNGAPMFARPLWDETSANPEIARRLRAARHDFYGLRFGGTDIAYFIDAAADRANLFATWQTLWHEGCGTGGTGDACRRDAFAAALGYATAGSLPAADALPALSRNWAKQWPQGLAIPNADLPNRDPFFPLADPAHDPLRLRPPQAVWRQPDVIAFAVGLAGMLDASLIERLRPIDAARRAAALDRLHAHGGFAAQTFDAAPLRALAAELGVAPAVRSSRLPAARTEPASASSATRQVFTRRCAACHDTTLAHPPNFLHGQSAQVEAQIDRCAERMYVRVSQAALSEKERRVAPMPPPSALKDAHAWPGSADFLTIRSDLAARLTRQGRDPQAVLRLPYARLAACPPATPYQEVRR
jgi:mono/diheme cytochrome c family protein